MVPLIAALALLAAGAAGAESLEEVKQRRWEVHNQYNSRCDSRNYDTHRECIRLSREVTRLDAEVERLEGEKERRGTGSGGAGGGPGSAGLLKPASAAKELLDERTPEDAADEEAEKAKPAAKGPKPEPKSGEASGTAAKDPAALAPVSQSQATSSADPPGDWTPGSEHACFLYRKARDAAALRARLKQAPEEDRKLSSYARLGLAYDCEHAVAAQRDTPPYRESCELGRLRKNTESFCMERRGRRTAEAKRDSKELRKDVDALFQNKVHPKDGFVKAWAPQRSPAGEAFGAFQAKYADETAGKDLAPEERNEIREEALDVDRVVDSYLLELSKPEISKETLDVRCRWPMPRDRDAKGCVKRLTEESRRRVARGASSNVREPGRGLSAAEAAAAGAAAGFAGGVVGGRLLGGSGDRGSSKEEDACEDSRTAFDACMKDQKSEASCCRYVRRDACKKELGCK